MQEAPGRHPGEGQGIIPSHEASTKRTSTGPIKIQGSNHTPDTTQMNASRIVPREIQAHRT
jgi:hypothetical protein